MQMANRESERPGPVPELVTVDRREVLRLLAGGALLLSTGGVLAGCGGGGSGNSSSGGNPQPGATPQLTLFPSAGNENLMTLQGSDGSVASYFGPKNDQGMPLGTITAALVQAAGGSLNDRAQIAYDARSAPTTVVLGDGRKVDFAYPSGTVVDFTPRNVDGTSIATLRWDAQAGTLTKITGTVAAPARSAQSQPHSIPMPSDGTGSFFVTEEGYALDLPVSALRGDFIPDQTPPGVPSGTRLNISFLSAPPPSAPGAFIYQVPQKPFAQTDDLTRQFIDAVKPTLDKIAHVLEDGVLSTDPASVALKITPITRSFILGQAAKLGLLAGELTLLDLCLTAIIAAGIAKTTINAAAFTITVSDLFDLSGSLTLYATYNATELHVTSPKVNPRFGSLPSLTIDFPPVVETVEISPTSLTLAPAETKPLTAVAKSKSKRIVPGQFVWKAVPENQEVVLFTQIGDTCNITGRNAGTTQIVVTETKSGKISSQPAKVTVGSIITISPQDAQILSVGSGDKSTWPTIQFSAAGGTPPYIWSIDSGIAGLFDPNKPGLYTSQNHMATGVVTATDVNGNIGMTHVTVTTSDLMISPRNMLGISIEGGTAMLSSSDSFDFYRISAPVGEHILTLINTSATSTSYLLAFHSYFSYTSFNFDGQESLRGEIAAGQSISIPLRRVP